MDFLTDDQKRKLLDNGKLENRDRDHAPVVKLFIPGTPCTWLLSELDYEEPNIAFGLCDLGMGFPELGSISLLELASVKAPNGMGEERDQFFESEYPMNIYCFAANSNQMITDDRFALKEAVEILSVKKDKLSAIAHNMN